MRAILKQMFLNSISFVNSNTLIESALRIKNGELVVGARTYPLTKNYYCVGFGKAVLGMAYEVEKILHDSLIQGIISVPVGSQKLYKGKNGLCFRDDSKFSIHEGAVNNLPDQQALKTAEKISELVTKLGDDDVLLVLISGGGSALLPLPLSPIDLEEKARTIKLLASHGATITELNGVRQNLSQIKGGKLAMLAYPAQVVGLILSDIIDDPIDFIASGPTAFPQCSPKEAVSILKKYAVYDQTPKSVILALEKPMNKPIDLSHVQNLIIGNNKIALEGTLRSARGYFDTSLILSNSVQGLVDNVAWFYADLVKLLCQQYLGSIMDEEFKGHASELMKKHNIVAYCNQDILRKLMLFQKKSEKGEELTSLCLLMGGEPTVHVQGNGLGGRNQELALNLGLRLSELAAANDWMSQFNVWFLSAGTDGADGPTDAAGAVTCIFQVKEAQQQGLNPHKYLANNDSHTFFSKLKNGVDLVKTGVTGTNVMDIHILAISYDS